MLKHRHRLEGISHPASSGPKDTEDSTHACSGPEPHELLQAMELLLPSAKVTEEAAGTAKGGDSSC